MKNIPLTVVIKINDHFLPEKKYTIEVLFDLFLGLQYKLVIDASVRDVNILLENGHILIIEDHFFNHILPGKLIGEDNLPQSAEEVKTNGDSLVSLYGFPRVLLNEGNVIIRSDLIAGAFYMLSRWEEYLPVKRDMYDRFPFYLSAAARFGFYHRPIVNEYIDWIWKTLQGLGIRQTKKQRNFALVTSHDIDLLRLWPNRRARIKQAGGDLLIRRSFKDFLWTITYRGARDPYDTFDYLLAHSENKGISPIFYWLADEASFKINHPENLDTMRSVLSRGHTIGFHPGMGTSKKKDLFLQQKDRLENAIGTDIKDVRQHYLQIHFPETLQIWNDACIRSDSTLGYSEKAGFRCGTCYSYPLYDFTTRSKSDVEEKPLVFMDQHLIKDQLTREEAIHLIQRLKESCKKHDGEFTVLWHNSSFFLPEWQPYEGVFESVFE